MSDEQGYNGWKNYPTWAVNLWLANDEPLYREALEKAREAVEDAPQDLNAIPDGVTGRGPIWTVEETARFRLADTLKDWVSDDLAPDLGASFSADLLGYALGCVDWEEIAVSWIESVKDA
jgi:hypothetical protein